MLTAEQNELLTRIGPGTPCGELMRRYWHPIAATSELEGSTWNKRIRLLGEDLVLFKDREGRLGLITEACPHRREAMGFSLRRAARRPGP
jgi:5,5'-dehydrodivanillate O-demethylase